MLRPNGRLIVPILRRGVALIQVYVRSPQGVMFTSEFDATMPRLWNWAPKEEFVF
jgi:protein-L-isoaspartate(D-aspartate) O-methyltransferase